MKQVGIIGLGIMGGAIARNLAAKGWRVVGFDTSADRRDEARENGVMLASGTMDLAGKAEIILTSLPSPAAVHAVAAEIVAAKAPKRIVVELSTLALSDKFAMRDALASAGHIGLDCPLSGTGAQAQKGDLVVFASGDTAAIDRCRAVFADFSRKTADLGEFGNGSKMKYVANHLVAVHNVATAEALVLGMKSGLDAQTIIEVISSGAGNSRVFELRAPMMAEKRYDPPTMRITTWKKDLDVIGGYAGELGVPLPTFDATLALYSAAKSMGYGGQDTGSVCAVLEAMAGLER
ncbi:MAG: NAD(P)-dependent oxidoreductase [Methylobacteriaceae bacterium]|nr:NAD(P)-dependent oxidoreductase [Methylobacteriaceae bacterium]MBV9393117.1 NAD(P)-dependent oxidoreductase [Methylobacteriaceae bacterium]